MFDIKAAPGCCEEAHHTSSDRYIPCNKPATQIILADGKELRMCDSCAHHSVKNRSMTKVRDIPVEDRKPALKTDNRPPDPIDTITAPFDDCRTEAEAWLDGTKVENEAQMKAADKLRGSMRDWRLALEKGQKYATAPLHDIYKAELERWKPTIEDAKRIEAGLVGIVDGFKRKLAAEKAEADRIAQAAAWEATRKAQEAARLADATNIEATRAAAQAMAEAEAAQQAAMAASKDTVKGMRTVTKYETEDDRAALHWIAANDKPAMAEFIAEYVRRNHKTKEIAGVRVWTEKEAF